MAATVHFLLRKPAFQTKLSQTKVVEKFLVQPKKLHIAMTGQKYDAGHKLAKKEKAECAAASSTTPSKLKVAKQDSTKDPQEKTKEQPMETDRTKMVDKAINTDSDNELPNPFPDQQKQFSGNIPDDALTQKGSNTQEKAFRTKNIPASKQKS